MYKSIKGRYKSIVAIMLILVLCTSTWIVSANNDAGIQVVELRKNMFVPDCIVLDSEESVDKVRGLRVNGKDCLQVSSPFSVDDTHYYLRKTTDYDGIDISLSDNAQIEIITDSGVLSFSIKLKDGKYVVVDNSDKHGNDKVDVPESTIEDNSNDQVDFTLTQVMSLGDFKVKIEPIEVKDKIKKVFVNNKEETKVSSKWYVFNGGYFIDDEGYFLMQKVPDTGSIITFELNDGKTISFKYVSERSINNRFEKISAEEAVLKELKARIIGHFEAGIVNQRGYDSVTAASAGATINKNSDVVLQVAEVDSGKEPTEEDWRTIENLDGYSIDTSKTEFYIDEQSGMRAVYGWYDGTVSLNGEPQNVGQYEVYGKVVDSKGREAVTNRLVFKVYPNDGKLIDYLKEENSRKMQDGKYIWDMEPWYIPNFSDNETVIVPQGIKAWYGSHTSGVYGVLGHEIEDVENTTQTLIIPSGADLTLVNMHIKTSVKIIVESGAKLRVIDSSIMGKVVVKDNALFQMNYDTVHRKFIVGAAINGQLILENGAILENSSIKSNTNYIANGNFERRNYEPVVKVVGNAVIRGEVYISGDDAADHDQKAQPALKVENATLTVEDDSLLYLQGGGIIIPSLGGDALVLDNGTIDGNGKLVAIGGYGMWNNGGDGVSGQGNISTKFAYLSGGNSLNTASTDTDITGGNGITENISIGEEVIGKIEKGILYSRVEDNNNPLLWKPALNAIADINKIDFGSDKIVVSSRELNTIEVESNGIIGVFKTYGDVKFIADTLAAETAKGIFVNDISDDEEIIKAYNIEATLNLGNEGKIILKLPIDKDKNIKAILHKAGDVTERYNVNIVNGYYVIEVDSLSPFALVADKIVDDNNSTDNGADNAGAVDNSSTDNGADNAGAVDNSSTANGADNAGAVDNSSTDNGADNAGAVDNSSTDNGVDNAGVADNSSTANGADNAGAVDNSSTANGADNAGVADNSSTANGADNTGTVDGNNTKITNQDNSLTAGGNGVKENVKKDMLVKTGVEIGYTYLIVLLIAFVGIFKLKKNK